MTHRVPPTPSWFSSSSRRPRRRLRVVALGLVAVLLAGSITAMGAVWTNAFGAGDRFANLLDRIDLIIDPPPDRPIAPTQLSTPRPIARATAAPTAVPTPTPASSPVAGVTSPPSTPTPAPTPEPTPRREPVAMRVTQTPVSLFNSQITKDWCAPAGVQMTLSVLGLAPATNAFQEELVDRAHEWESRRDSLNGGWGPAAMVQALEAYGARGYEIRAYGRRSDALLDAARAMGETQAPAILLAWRGAHTWVMIGYRATADPLVFEDAKITGAYILDPWYPRVSSIWGASDPPGTFQDEAEMERNFLQWKRPEGKYPDRDGKWIVVIPTIHASDMG